MFEAKKSMGRLEESRLTVVPARSFAMVPTIQSGCAGQPGMFMVDLPVRV
jgi:hypothetical protein